jgi:protein SCO1/2
VRTQDLVEDIGSRRRAIAAQQTGLYRSPGSLKRPTPRRRSNLIDRRVRALLLIASLVLPPAGTATAHTAAPASIAGFELPVPKALQPFALHDHRGVVFDNAKLAGRWTFLLFGYTHCADVCPTALLQLDEVRRTLATRYPGVPAATVFATVDPKRDTRERLAAYAAHFGGGLLAVGGTPTAIKAFADQFRVRYARRPGPPDTPAYDIDHTASVALLGPDGKLHAVFTLPLRPEQVAADVARMHATHPWARCDAGPAAARDQACSMRST